MTGSIVRLAAVAAMAFAGTAWAEDIYVSTNGTQTAPYNAWTNSFKDLQAALEYAGAKANATIYLAGGQELTGLPYGKAHPFNTLFYWEKATNVRLLGGWDTTAAPPVTRTAGPTVLRRTHGDTRVMTLSGLSNCVIEQVTIREGRNGTQYASGAGVLVTNCWDVTFSTCSILNNTNTANNAPGTGLGLQRSSVVLTNCTIADNYCNMDVSGGGGLYVDTLSRLTMVRSFLLRNQAGSGGNTGAPGPGFYNQGQLNMIETVVAGNQALGGTGPGAGGCNEGYLWMQNCLVVSNRCGYTWGVRCADGIELNSGTGVFVNCTVAANSGYGMHWRAGAVAMTNCIVWGHTTADLLSFPKDANGVLTNVWYSDIGDGQNQGYQGCLKTEPLFVDTRYCHLKSAVSNYTGGYFTGGSWGASATTSPLIDRGAPPPFDYSREPAPNGSWVNIGYDGNTELASESPTVTVTAPTVLNDGAVAVGHRRALLRGEVTATGGEFPLAFFRYWVSGSGTTNEIAAGYTSGYFERSATGLMVNTAYEYLVAASNSAGQTVSAVSNFTTHPSPSYLYVATNGDNTAGTNWVTAYTAVQTALNVAETGDTIYLAGQTFAGGMLGNVPPHPANTFLTWRNATNIALRGGYDAEAGKGGSSPGARSGTTTVTRTVGSVRVLTMIGVTNAVIERMTFQGGANGTQYSSGAGVYLTNCWDVTFSTCSVLNNTNTANYAPGTGLGLQRSSVVLTNCTIADNYCNVDQSGGGGLYVDTGSRLTMVRSFLLRNQVGNGGNTGGPGPGFYNQGRLNMIETVVAGNQALGQTAWGAGGCNEGYLWIQNCLVVSNLYGYTWNGRCADGIDLGGGKATVLNCTIVGNGSVGLAYAGGAAAVSNSIIWGHTAADLTNFPAGSVGYCAVGVPRMQGVNGCITGDPLFVGADANDYRLKDEPFSPCIDNGMAQPWMEGASDLGGLPRVSGRNVDMGAYEYRPLSFIRPAGVSNITASAAVIRGNVTWSGPANVALSLFHGPADGGTDPKAWANEVKLPGPRGPGMHETTISHSASNSVWFYRYRATNPYGVYWAESTGNFIDGAVEVRATRRASTEEKPAAFVISRTATATNGPLAVYYNLGGTGRNGEDYDPLESPAVIPAGASEVRLPVIPNFNMGDSRSKGVELAIAPGGYMIGANNKASIVTKAQ